MNKFEILCAIEDALAKHCDNIEGVSVMPDKTVRVATRHGDHVEYQWFKTIARAKESTRPGTEDGSL